MGAARMKKLDKQKGEREANVSSPFAAMTSLNKEKGFEEAPIPKPKPKKKPKLKHKAKKSSGSKNPAKKNKLQEITPSTSFKMGEDIETIFSEMGIGEDSVPSDLKPKKKKN